MKSTIDWCEKNYEYIYFIAEFWNTISSFSLIYAGIQGWHRHEKVKGRNIFSVLFLVGIGSVFFHSCLTVYSQMFDEIPMIFLVVYMLENSLAFSTKTKIFSRFFSLTYSSIIFYTALYSTERQLEFYIFQASFIFQGCILFFVFLKMQKSLIAERIFKKGIFYFLTAWSFWLVDYFLCKYFTNYNLQFHAWWHVFSSIGVYNFCILSIYNRNKKSVSKPVYIYPCILWSFVSHDVSR